ncbi:X2-like carbohydrate binding domain-containing protein [Chloroflexota bacterium]
MGGKFRLITQVFCVLVLTLSVGLATSVSVMAAEFPDISPTTAEYDLDDPAEVVAVITWGDASSIVAVSDDDGNLTPGLTRDYIVLVKHLVILNYYLEDKLTDIGDSVELVVKFDLGATTLTITATGTQPSISPTTAQYDLDDPADVETTITWGIATSVASIVDDDGHTLTSTQRSVSGTDVTIRSTQYLAGKLTEIGDEVVLTINFNKGDPATFTITATGTQPSISPTTAQYNIDSPADVGTTITWGTASSVASIVDDDGHTLTGTQYTVTSITPGVSASLTIRSTQYLASMLTNIGDKVVLTIKFNLGNNATFEITATGVNAVISPTTAQYDLDNQADAKTVITWNTAASVTSIVDGAGHTLTGTEYTLAPVTPGVSADLTVLNSTYLAGQLTDIGDNVVLTIKFDLGADATFTITAVGVQPRISPQTKEYDLDNPSNAVTTVTWGTATSIVSIVDDDQYTLIKDADYTVTAIDADSVTLTILAEPYIEGKHMGIGDSIVLSIDFNVGVDATFTITSMGIQPSISPVTADYDVINRNDVTTIITWGSATSVVSLLDDSGYLLAEGMHYTVSPVTPGVSANLTILSSTYLATKLSMFGEQLVLTIGFDVGRDATLTITVPPVCFIATAAYGTPTAEEIQILREFRDEYLLTNPVGQALVDIYYRTSPPVAEFITEHPSLKSVVRAGLLPAVAMSAVAVNTTPVEKTAIIGLLVLVAVAVWAIRQRRRGPEYTRG